jgi:hypothetical protein
MLCDLHLGNQTCLYHFKLFSTTTLIRQLSCMEGCDNAIVYSSRCMQSLCGRECISLQPRGIAVLDFACLICTNMHTLLHYS